MVNKGDDDVRIRRVQLNNLYGSSKKREYPHHWTDDGGNGRTRD